MQPFIIRQFCPDIITRLVLVLCASLIAGAAWAAEPLSAIRFVGNAVTRPIILLQEMAIKPGDPADPVRIEQARQAVMDLGLFSEVRADLEPAPDGPILVITVQEKHYFIPIPRINRESDGALSYGAEMRFDNLMGLNQRLVATVEARNATEAASGQEGTLAVNYSYPRIAGTLYGFDVNTRHIIHPVAAATGNYNHETTKLAVVGSRFLGKEGPSQGWRVGAGMSWNDETKHHARDIPEVQRDVGFSALVFNAMYTDLHDLLYSREGEVIGADVALGTTHLGMSEDYIRYSLLYQHYIPLSGIKHRSLNLQFRTAFSIGNPYHDGANNYSLGSSSTLRGYTQESVKGKAYVLANIEYLTPFPRYPAFQGSLFLDVGNAYAENLGINLLDLKTSVGTGLRFKLKSFVNVQLRLDMAYAIETQQYKVYVGTKAIF